LILRGEKEKLGKSQKKSGDKKGERRRKGKGRRKTSKEYKTVRCLERWFSSKNCALPLKERTNSHLHTN